MADQQLNIRLDAIDNTTKAFKNLKNNLNDVGKTANNVKSSFFTLKNAVRAFVASAIIRNIIETTKTFQSLRSRLISATGSINDGTEAFKYLSNFAKKTEFSVRDVTDAFLVLYQNGVAPTEQLLNVFTKTASNASDKVGALNDLVKLFSRGAQSGGIGIQALTKLVDNGIPVFEILENKLGRNKDALKELAQSSTGSKKILDTLFQGLSEQADTSANKTDNLSTRINIFSKNLQDAFFAIGETKVFNKLFDAMSKLLDTMKPILTIFGQIGFLIINSLVVAYESLASIIQEVIDWVEGLYNWISDLLEPFKEITDFIKNTAIVVFDKFRQGLDSIKKSYKEFKELVLGKKQEQPVVIPINRGQRDQGSLPPPKPKTLNDFSEILRIVEGITDQLNISKDAFESIYITAGKIAVEGIKGISNGIAEAIVLGKKLNESFRELSQKILIRVLDRLIEEQLTKLAIYALDQLKLFIEKQRTAEIVKQNALLAQQRAMSGGGGGGLFGSILGSFGKFFGGGGGTGGINTAVISPFAEGGSVKGGEPITVGERGREVFMPKTDGTIIPNEKLGGNTNINFSITATDVRGVKELLIDNRATITNIVNQALNSRGKPALV